MANAGETHRDQFALYKGKETVGRQIIESTSGSPVTCLPHSSFPFPFFFLTLATRKDFYSKI